MDYRLALVLIVILLAVATGHTKVALGITSSIIFSVLAFYVITIIALRNWNKKII